MEKKEPVLDTKNIGLETKVAKESVDTKNSFETENKKTLTDKQKKVILGILISLVVIVAIIAFLPSKKADKKMVSADKKGSFLSSLFKSEKKTITPPAFDIVRMEKGETIIAGTAEKNAVVYIVDNGKKLGSEKADDNGQWVFIPKKALKTGNHKLSLYVMGENGNRIYAKQNAILHVSKKTENEVAVLMGNKKSKVLKAPKGDDIGALRVAKIAYNDNGTMNIEGLAVKNTKVNLYMNNNLIVTATTDEFGIFVAKAEYKMTDKTKQVLRADMVAENGKVLRRVAYNFTPIFYEGKNNMTVIKKGDCLWNIALKEYGKGTEYLILFEANKSQIKDPNKIYVGQVFSILEKDSKSYNEIKEKVKQEMKNKKK